MLKSAPLARTLRSPKTITHRFQPSTPTKYRRQILQ